MLILIVHHFLQVYETVILRPHKRDDWKDYYLKITVEWAFVFNLKCNEDDTYPQALSLISYFSNSSFSWAQTQLTGNAEILFYIPQSFIWDEY